MNKDAIALPNTRSWRDIPQEVKPRAMSPEGRRRVAISVIRAILLVGALSMVAWTAWKISAVFTDDTHHMPAAAKAVPIKTIVATSRGVLTTEWVKATLALPASTTLMQVDLSKAKETLLANPQVLSAEILRQFPSTLEVHLTERNPVARVNAQLEDNATPRPFMVASDGVVYEGLGYSQADLIDTLVWLDGIRLVRSGKGFAPIPGMDWASSLISEAKFSTPALYAHWQVLSLAKFASDGQVEVRMDNGTRVFFSKDETPHHQLAELDELLDLTKAEGKGPIKTIDLTVGPQIQIVFGDPASPDLPGGAPAPSTTLSATLLKSPSVFFHSSP